MLRKWGIALVCLLMMTALLGCGNESNTGAEGNKKGSKSSKTLKLPDRFPKDFPLPDGMVLTRVEDNSEGDEFDFSLRFDFDPNIDMDATFEKYDKYAKGLEYNITLGGEEYFANGIFQFGAAHKMLASNMFIVTLKPDGGTFGDIRLRFTDNND